MIKIILGNQPVRKGLITNPDTRIVTSENIEDIATSVIRAIDSNSANLKDPNLGSLLGKSDLVSPTDFKVLQEVLSESRMGLVVAKIHKEVGDPETADIQIVVVNESGTGVIKPGVSFYFNAMNVNELGLIETIKDDFRLFPDALFSNTAFNNALAGEKELERLKLTRNEVNIVALKNTLERLGFSYYIIKL